MKHAAISLECCQNTISEGSEALRLNPFSTASTAKASIPAANARCMEERLPFKKTKTASPPEKKAVTENNKILKVGDRVIPLPFPLPAGDRHGVSCRDNSHDVRIALKIAEIQGVRSE